MSCRYRGRKFPLTEVIMPSNPATQQQGIIRCRAGVGGQGSHEAMESPQALMCPLEKWVSGINKSSSDDRPVPGIRDSKYVEDAKAARSVRVWDRVPMKNMG